MQHVQMNRTAPQLALLALLSLPSSAWAQEAELFDGRNLQLAPSDGDARDFCEALQSAGGKCFVRSIAGDAPVRLAAL